MMKELPKVGDLVLVVGHEQEGPAKVDEILNQTRYPGGVRLNPPVWGFSHWNIDALVLAPVPESAYGGVMKIYTDLNLVNLEDWELNLLLKKANEEFQRRSPPKRNLPPLSTDEERMVQYDLMIPAIKAYRQRNESWKPTLRESKDLCDAHRALCQKNGTFVAAPRQ
jgi:hypothetical protein